MSDQMITIMRTFTDSAGRTWEMYEASIERNGERRYLVFGPHGSGFVPKHGMPGWHLESAGQPSEVDQVRDQFKVGDTWIHPRGTHYDVIEVRPAPRTYVAILVSKNGRRMRRDYDATFMWKRVYG